MSSEWKVMPTSHGAYWFCNKLEDRDLAEFVRVTQIQSGAQRSEFYRNADAFCSTERKRPIGPTEGYWLRIPDERMTAKLPPSSGDHI